MILSLGGSKVWIPIIDVSSSFKVGHEFESIESDEQQYRRYVDIAGFDIRLSNKKKKNLG